MGKIELRGREQPDSAIDTLDRLRLREILQELEALLESARHSDKEELGQSVQLEASLSLLRQLLQRLDQFEARLDSIENKLDRILGDSDD